MMSLDKQHLNMTLVCACTLSSQSREWEPDPVQPRQDGNLAGGEEGLAELASLAHAGTSMDRTRAATRPLSAGLLM